MYTQIVLSFRNYLLEKLQDYEKQQSRRSSLDEFAGWLGVSRPLVSYWINGKYKPSLENAQILAKKLGAEVYDILGFPRPDPDLQALTDLWPSLTEDTRHTLREQAEKYATKNEDRQPKSSASEPSV